MKVICSKDELMKGIGNVMPVTQSKNALPILANLLFKIEDNAVQISATDLERAVKCRIKGEIIEEGAVTIPSKWFSDFIRELPADAQIEINADDSNQINIKAAKSKVNVTGIDASEYPAIPDFPKENSISIGKDILISMFKKTIFSVSKDPQRHILNGVYLLIEEGVLKMVSTDGRRLAYIFAEGMDAKIKKKAIVPTAVVNDILRIISGDIKEENIKIGLSENQFGVSFDNIEILSILVEGLFPNYEQVIPKKSDMSVSIKTEEILAAVKITKTIVEGSPSADASSAILFSFDKNLLKVSSSAAGIGHAETEIEIEYKDKPLEIRFNPSYIEDVLKNLGEEFLNFEFSDSLNPALMSPQKNKNYLCVVMPMRP